MWGRGGRASMPVTTSRSCLFNGETSTLTKTSCGPGGGGSSMSTTRSTCVGSPNCSIRMARISTPLHLRPGVRPGLDGLDAVDERLLQYALADRSEYERQDASLEVLALADNDNVHIRGAVGTGAEGVNVARGASPGVRVGGCQRHAVGIGPVVVQTFPYAA